MLVTALWCCIWGMGREGAMVLAPLSAGFQSLPLLPTIKLGPSGADSRVDGFVHAPGPCGSLQWSLLWGWEFLLLPPQPPWVFSIRGLRLYFPTLKPWVAWSASLPCCSSQFIYMWIWGHRVCQPPPCGVCQLQPGLPRSTICHLSESTSRRLAANPLHPQLPISAPPSGLDECFFFISLVVRLPYSSVLCQFWLFFLFLNCFCSSFGCGKRHSVSTYASILARNPFKPY